MPPTSPIRGPDKVGFPIAPRTGTESVRPHRENAPGPASPQARKNTPGSPSPAKRDATGTADTAESDPSPGRGLDPLARWIAVVGGAGYAPVAPGTMGSLVAALAFAGAVDAAASSGPVVAAMGLGLAIVVTFALGTWASGRAERLFGRHDDGRIVVDEVVGQWLTLAPIVPFLGVLDSFSLGLAVVTGFVAFRVFDVWKPGAVRWAERRFEGGLGVMADDVVAGVYGALLVVLPLGLFLRDRAIHASAVGALGTIGTGFVVGEAPA